MRAKVLFLSCLWLAAAVAIFSIPGCYGENCNGGVVTYGPDPGQGHMVGPDLWESNADNEAWLPFPRQRGYIFDVSAWGGRVPFDVIPYLSANEHQNEPGANQVIGAGNIALMINKRANGIDIRNDTCSDYYLRLTVILPPMSSAAPTATGTTPPPPADAGSP